MPKTERESALARQWELLKLLIRGRRSTQESAWLKASELSDQLRDIGYEISNRTIQRDLVLLSSMFPIDVNDKNPKEFGWRWKSGAGISFNSLDTPEATMILLAERYLTELMPPAMLANLQPLFGQARQRLSKLPASMRHKPESWLDNVFIAPPQLTRLAPVIDDDIYQSIYRALYEGLTITAVYQKPLENHSFSIQLKPQGLMLKGKSIYVIATRLGNDKAKYFALHRFKQVDIAPLEDEADIADPAIIFDQNNEFYSDQQPITLKLSCSARQLPYLLESPLAADQQIEAKGDKFIISLTSKYSYELRNFLREFMTEITVLEPVSLREKIMQDIRIAYTNYECDR